jgi:hypothetical protein
VRRHESEDPPWRAPLFIEGAVLSLKLYYKISTEHLNLLDRPVTPLDLTRQMLW